MQVSLKSDKNKVYITFSIMSRSILLRMKNIANKTCRETWNPHFIYKNFFQKSGRAGHRYGACALHAGYLRLQMHKQAV